MPPQIVPMLQSYVEEPVKVQYKKEYAPPNEPDTTVAKLLLAKHQEAGHQTVPTGDPEEAAWKFVPLPNAIEYLVDTLSSESGTCISYMLGFRNLIRILAFPLGFGTAPELAGNFLPVAVDPLYKTFTHIPLQSLYAREIPTLLGQPVGTETVWYLLSGETSIPTNTFDGMQKAFEVCPLPKAMDKLVDSLKEARTTANTLAQQNHDLDQQNSDLQEVVGFLAKPLELTLSFPLPTDDPLIYVTGEFNNQVKTKKIAPLNLTEDELEQNSEGIPLLPTTIENLKRKVDRLVTEKDALEGTVRLLARPLGLTLLPDADLRVQTVRPLYESDVRDVVCNSYSRQVQVTDGDGNTLDPKQVSELIWGYGVSAESAFDTYSLPEAISRLIEMYGREVVKLITIIKKKPKVIKVPGPTKYIRIEVPVPGPGPKPTRTIGTQPEKPEEEIGVGGKPKTEEEAEIDVSQIIAGKNLKQMVENIMGYLDDMCQCIRLDRRDLFEELLQKLINTILEAIRLPSLTLVSLSGLANPIWDSEHSLSIENFVLAVIDFLKLSNKVYPKGVTLDAAQAGYFTREILIVIKGNKKAKEYWLDYIENGKGKICKQIRESYYDTSRNSGMNKQYKGARMWHKLYESNPPAPLRIETISAKLQRLLDNGQTLEILNIKEPGKKAKTKRPLSVR
jgi:hypothetical protein